MKWPAVPSNAEKKTPWIAAYFGELYLYKYCPWYVHQKDAKVNVARWISISLNLRSTHKKKTQLPAWARIEMEKE